MKRFCRMPSIAVALCLGLLALAAASPIQAGTARAASADVAPVDINKATADGLTVVPGIGKATAQRIVAWREEHGPFRRVEDLMKVKGIGEKTLEKIRPYVKVSKGR